MSKAHYIAPAAVMETAQTVRLGASANPFDVNDQGKFVKLAAESQYNLCAAGDPIEAICLSVDTASSGGFAIGSIVKGGVFYVIADGLQATPGTGTIAVGDYVVCGTVTALNTALAAGFPKVCKATVQPGTTEASAAGDVNDHLKIAMNPWRVVSLGTAGTGAVGTVIAIERVTS